MLMARRCLMLDRSAGERIVQQARDTSGDNYRQCDSICVLRYQQLFDQHRHDARYLWHNGRFVQFSVL